MIDVVLAGDNAIVIGLAAARVPLVMRKKVILWGLIAAVVLRIAMAAVAVQLLAIIGLMLAGGILLLWVAWKLVRPQEEALEAAAHPEKAHRHASSLWHAVRIIIIADVVMSLDNVIAIAGIAKEGSDSPHGEMGLVIFGLLLSIPLVICGSALIAKLMDRFRWMIWLGGGVLGHVAGKIIFQDPRVLGWLGVPAKIGMSSAALPWVRGVVLGVPWIFAVLLFVLGAWWSCHSMPPEKTDGPTQ